MRLKINYILSYVILSLILLHNGVPERHVYITSRFYHFVCYNTFFIYPSSLLYFVVSYCRDIINHFPYEWYQLHTFPFHACTRKWMPSIAVHGKNKRVVWIINIHRQYPLYALNWNCISHYHAVSANRILWVYAGFWWYHGILVVHLQDSVGAFGAKWPTKHAPVWRCLCISIATQGRAALRIR